MSVFNSIYSLVNPRAQEKSISFLSHNNTPVNNFCSIIPIIQPSLITTPFGQSVITLSVLGLYVALYLMSGDRTKGVEFRILTSLLVGNLLFTILAFRDWFNLAYAIIFCNDYKNGVSNLYQVSELIETYKLGNLIQLHLKFGIKLIQTYSKLIYKQFFRFFIDGIKEATQIIQSYVKS